MRHWIKYRPGCSSWQQTILGWGYWWCDMGKLCEWLAFLLGGSLCGVFILRSASFENIKNVGYCDLKAELLTVKSEEYLHFWNNKLYKFKIIKLWGEKLRNFNKLAWVYFSKWWRIEQMVKYSQKAVSFVIDNSPILKSNNVNQIKILIF